MNRTTTLTGVLAVFVLATALTPFLGLAAAQEEDTPATTPTASGNATVLEQVDARLVVTGFEYQPERERFEISLENTGEERSTVTITEAISARAANSGRFGVEVFRVAPGEKTTVIVRSFTARPLGVMVTTRASIEEGHGTFLPAERRGGGQLIGGGATGGDVRATAVFGILGTLGIILLGSWHYVSAENEDVEEIPMGEL